MTRLCLNTDEGQIILSEAGIQMKMKSGRCRELFLSQHFVELLAKASGLIDAFFAFLQEGLAYEIMFGETPSQDVLDGKKVLDLPMLTIAKARGNNRFWFGYVSKPTHVTWRDRQRVLVSGNFLDILVRVALKKATEEVGHKPKEDFFWLVRGKFADGERGFTFNSATALVEFRANEYLGIKRVDASIWASLAVMAGFTSESGDASLAEDFVPDQKRPEISARVEVIEEDIISIVLYRNGLVQSEETYELDILDQVLVLMGALWQEPLDESILSLLLIDEDEEDED